MTLWGLGAKMQEPEVLNAAMPPLFPLTNPTPSGTVEDILDKPVTEVFFVAFRNEVYARFAEIEKFIDIQKQQEGAKLRDTALDIPKEIKIGRKTYQLHRLPAGYRILMMQKLQKIAELIPKQEPPPIERLVECLRMKNEKTPEQLAQELLEVTRQPGLLARIAPYVPEIFDAMLEVIQLAIQAGQGKPTFENGVLKNPVVDLDTLRWECNDIEGIFNDIIGANIPIFFTIQSVQRTLAV
jgi:hypothetical protein